ncbi:MAG: DUF58 domain-containing protein [Isosphaeraceae bacterium]
MTTSRGYRFLEPSALARVQNLALVARGVVEGFISGLHASPYKGFSVEFAEHRNYTPGDNLRYLDWRILGRTDRLSIKQYEEETNLRCQILLDTSASMGYASDPARGVSKLVYGSYLAAILAHLMMRQQDAVGLTTFDTEPRLELPPASSPRQLDEMMKRLEKLQAGRSTALAATLHLLAERFKRRSLLVLLTDLHDEVEAIEGALHHLRHKRHEVILFHILDPAERDLPYREMVNLVDLETGERIEVDPASVREEYRRQVEEALSRFRRICAECRIDYVLADTTVPYDFMLSRYLESRART